MDSKEFYNIINHSPFNEFIQVFGGEFYDGMNFGYLYEFNKTSYYLNEDFVNLAKLSLKQNKNLFLELEKVIW